ncbi:MAG: hypothetical protein JNJ57_03390, partial [Saprospiraceae bacterium]|nr:hypothetical protein [Saprospiraceae bacterium]
DNCFQNSRTTGAPKLIMKGENHQLTVQASARKFPFFQVFTPPHRESIALEPMTCNVDALNNEQGLISLKSGKKWTGKMEIKMD